MPETSPNSTSLRVPNTSGILSSATRRLPYTRQREWRRTQRAGSRTCVFEDPRMRREEWRSKSASNTRQPAFPHDNVPQGHQAPPRCWHRTPGALEATSAETVEVSRCVLFCRTERRLRRKGQRWFPEPHALLLSGFGKPFQRRTSVRCVS